jgi:hypothetical protein
MATSPGPALPRVATVSTPTRPTEDLSLAIEDSSISTRQPPLPEVPEVSLVVLY